MTHTHDHKHAPLSTARHDVRRVLLVTLMLNIAVSLGKLGVGVASGSLSIVADGFHSLMDGASNVVALLANWLASRPADESHPYGHRRFETLAALGIGFLLIVTAFELITSAIERIGTGDQPIYTALTFAVMIGTLMVNLLVVWYERREGRRLKSELLLADAAHTTSDVFVTLSVLVSMVLVQLGIAWADSVTALVVVVLIGRAAFVIVRQNGGVLADAAPIPAEALKRAAEEVPAAGHILRARSRGPADSVYVALDVEVPAATTAERTEAITDAIRKSIEARFDGIEEVEVHFVPTANGNPDPALLARALADPLNLSVHEVRLIQHDGQHALELHVEVPPDSTLEEAHARASALEAALRDQMPDVASITTHIEPAAPAQPSNEPDPADAELIRAAAARLLEEHFPGCNWHDVHVTAAESGLALTAHAGMAANLPVLEAHRISEEAEVLLRRAFPNVSRVTLHTEPNGE